MAGKCHCYVQKYYSTNSKTLPSDVVDNFFNPNPPQLTTSEEDPYLMWAVDGQTSTFRPVFRTQQSAEEVLKYWGYLFRVFLTFLLT